VALLVALAVFSAGPIWQIARSWYFSGFRPDAPFMYLSTDHRAVIEDLKARATTADVLLAEGPDLLWMAPEHPGRLYLGHFFLTPNYRQKREALELAMAEPDSLGPLLDRSGARWLFANTGRDVARVARVPGLTVVRAGAAGTLFEVRRAPPGGG
jgi:hypothetical protein